MVLLVGPMEEGSYVFLGGEHARQGAHEGVGLEEGHAAVPPVAEGGREEVIRQRQGRRQQTQHNAQHPVTLKYCNTEYCCVVL